MQVEREKKRRGKSREIIREKKETSVRDGSVRNKFFLSKSPCECPRSHLDETVG